MKTCSKCNEKKSFSEFGKSGRTKDGLNTICKSCKREIDKQYYEKNKKAHNNRNEKSRYKKKDFVIEMKKKSPCKKCGESRWYLLDFHHIDPTKKEYGIATVMTGGYSMDTLIREINKCVTLCKNCHSEFHYLERENNILLENYI